MSCRENNCLCVCTMQHTDMTFRPCPPLGSILHGIVIPSEPNESGNQAGDTEFFSMSAAYDALDDALKARYTRPKLMVEQRFL